MTNPDEGESSGTGDRRVLDYQRPSRVERWQWIRLGSPDDFAFTVALAGGFFFIASSVLMEAAVGVYGAILLVAAAAAAVVDERRTREAGSGRPRGRITWPVLVMTALLSFNLTRCPHARYFHFGPYRFAVTGDPCRNQQVQGPWWFARSKM
ncbi:MAG TPA: hypothetical protein VF624_12860 [Tepidisphaeraceae bacterium]|jgi:hypothetical protein